jgi:hypothetical protein
MMALNMKYDIYHRSKKAGETEAPPALALGVVK